MSIKQRKQMIEPELREPSISRQCQLLSLSRSSFYYAPVPISAEDLELMRLIDEQYLKTPTYGSRSMARHFWRQGRKVNRKRIQRLMRLMGIEAVYPKPHTSRPHPEHRIYPYLLSGTDHRSPNQVWAADITYVPMSRGFMYLVAVMDWHSRKILSWRRLQHPGLGFLQSGAPGGSWNATASLRSSTRIKEPSLPAPRSPRSSRTRDRHQHGRPRPMPGQHLRRTAVVDHQTPLPLPTFVQLGYWTAPRTHRVGSLSTTTSAATRRLTTGHRMRFITDLPHPFAEAA